MGNGATLDLYSWVNIKRNYYLQTKMIFHSTVSDNWSWLIIPGKVSKQVLGHLAEPVNDNLL